MLSLEKTFREKLFHMYHSAPLDAASFHRLYKACGPGECEAMCCHGGSGFYMSEEGDTIKELTVKHRDFFLKNGVPIDGELFDTDTDEETGVVEVSTATHPMEYTKGLKPEHFPSTSCIFRRKGDGACTLQVLSVEQGKPGWWYKPIACWLYPLELEHGGKPFISVAHESTDEYIDDDYPGFVGFTPCGMECKKGTGRPAYQVLEGEIAALSKLIDRDLLSEILAYKKEEVA